VRKRTPPRKPAKAGGPPRGNPPRPKRPSDSAGRPLRAPKRVPKEQAHAALAVLKKTYPDAECALNHRSAFELLVSVILSAQCTDARVNLTTPALFDAYPTPYALAKAPLSDVETLVKSTGFFRNKAKNIVGAAQRLVEAYGGEVPQGMDDLLSLPGVARKTANVVRGVVHGLADGVVVDTHVLRLSNRLGWAKSPKPEHVEQTLMSLFPKDDWLSVADVLIDHGRSLCHARSPRCPDCPVAPLCPTAPK
jgi:endonuclease-3